MQSIEQVKQKLKGWLSSSNESDSEAGEATSKRAWVKIIGIAFVAYLILGLILAFFWSSEPEQFSIREITLNQVGGKEENVVVGAYTAATLIHVVETMLDKPGGYLSNDVTFPGIWMDNIPNWEYGVIIQVRDLTKAMREAFSRSQSQSLEDRDLALAESRFNFDHNSWLMPQTESEYQEGIKYLQSYLTKLTDQSKVDAQFYARADNLRYWLSTIETRLGSLSQRLSASVGQRRVNTDLSGDPNAQNSTTMPNELDVKTPWLELDDEFYRARGSAWAILHFLKAVELDFADALDDKNAKVSLQQIIRELEGTQEAVFSPVILNGGGFGMLANHSLVMANYISRANAAIIDLRELLSQG